MLIESKTEDVAKAHPRIVEAVETMLKKGKWTVPGMLWSLLLGLILDPQHFLLYKAIKRSLATSTSCSYWNIRRNTIPSIQRENHHRFDVQKHMTRHLEGGSDGMKWYMNRSRTSPNLEMPSEDSGGKTCLDFPISRDEIYS